MNDDDDRAQSALRTQQAVLRTLTDELQRQPADTEGIHAQAVAESERLISTMEGLRSRACAAGVSRAEGAAGEAKHKPRILVVDDDDEIRAAMARWLAPEHEVVAACDGAEGLERACAKPPDVIVTDVSMPKMDGIRMVERIRERLAPATVPVIFLTGHSEPENVTAGFAAGGTAYLVKPVDFALLDGELRWALGAMRER